MGLFDSLSGALSGAMGQVEAAAMPTLISCSSRAESRRATELSIGARDCVPAGTGKTAQKLARLPEHAYDPSYYNLRAWLKKRD
jgi:hypothetical protein